MGKPWSASGARVRLCSECGCVLRSMLPPGTLTCGPGVPTVEGSALVRLKVDEHRGT